MKNLTKENIMYALKAIEKPRWAKKSINDFFYRDRARKDCEGIEDATKFDSLKEAQSVHCEISEFYEIVEIN